MFLLGLTQPPPALPRSAAVSVLTPFPSLVAAPPVARAASPPSASAARAEPGADSLLVPPAWPGALAAGYPCA